MPFQTSSTLLLVASIAQCPPTYSLNSVNGPMCGVFGPEPAMAFGMNGFGDVVCGESTTCQAEHFGFRWTPGQPIRALSFGVATTYSRAVDANDFGRIVGEVDAMGQSGRRGFVWDETQSVFLQPLPGGAISSALAANNSGLVVGSSIGGGGHAVYWIGGKCFSLRLPIGPNSSALGVNDVGQVCGWMGLNTAPIFGCTPFIWHNGDTISLPLPAYALEKTGVATALNNHGDACGYFFIDDPASKGFLRRACAWIAGEFIDLGVLPGGQVSAATDINDAREIVGHCIVNGFHHAFVWRDGAMMDLADLVPPGNVIPQDARAINNLGQIAGGAALLPDNDGVAFRLTPVLPAIPGNTNCDDQVNADDLINVILHWNADGPVGGRPADVNRDNRIDMDDLLAVLLNWSRP
jgi:probable HAF family extracellular repeat protein